MIRQPGRIVDCSPPRTVNIRHANTAGEAVQMERVTVVSFFIVFPSVAPGQVMSLWAGQHRMDVDGRAVSREPFRSRWGPIYEGFIVDNFNLSAFGETMPEIHGYVVGAGVKAGTA